MSHRLSFHLVRVLKSIETGIVEIDVEDPEDYNEIADKLKEKKFVSFLVTEKENIEDDNWSYQPKI